MTELITTINSWAWGPLMLVLLLGTGLYLSIGLRFITVRKIPAGLRLMLQGRKGKGEGDISPFGALMTSLSATIGTGNIAGVATAVFAVYFGAASFSMNRIWRTDKTFWTQSVRYGACGWNQSNFAHAFGSEA